MVANQVISVLTTNAAKIGIPAESIYFGRFGELPTATPFLMVFIEPDSITKEQRGYPLTVSAVVQLFAGSGIEDNANAYNPNAMRDAIYMAIAFVERATQLLLNTEDYEIREQPLFDNVYDSTYAVASCELTTTYEYHELLS